MYNWKDTRNYRRFRDENGNVKNYPFSDIVTGSTVYDYTNKDHQAISLAMGEESAVLLKNNGVLPLSASDDVVLTGEFAEAAGACAIIRGVRNTTDFEYERTMEATNHRIYPDITTVMLFTPSPVADISSSTVREVLSFGRTVEEFMPIGIDINKYL